MLKIHQEAERFVEFVQRTFSSDKVGPPLEECLRMWREEQELAETVAAIKRGEANFAAGRCMTLEEAERRLRAELRVSADNA